MWLAAGLFALGCGGGCHGEPEVAGNGPSEARPPGTRALEPEFEAQLAAVRSGQSDRIHLTRQPVAPSMLEQLAGLGRLRTLLIDAGRVTDRSAGSLRSLEGLRQLRLRQSPIGDAGLAEIAEIPTLQVLNLPHSEISDSGPTVLRQLPDLHQLRLGSSRATAAICGSIAELKNLRSLHLIDIPVDDAGLMRLASLPELHSLYLDGAAVTDAGWQWLFDNRSDLHVHIDQAHHDRDPERHVHTDAPR